MKNKEDKIIMVISTLAFVLLLTIALVGQGKVIEEGLCVDGDGDINLAGIMCEKEIETYYGHELAGEYFVFSVFMANMIAMFISGMFMMISILHSVLVGGREEEE